MTLEELIQLQKNFDENHKGRFNWSEKICDDNLEILEYLLICLVGEFGEASNLIKKVIRGDCKLEEIREPLDEEIIDILIYVIKMIYQLDIDVEKVYEKKMKRNVERFKKFEINERG